MVTGHHRLYEPDAAVGGAQYGDVRRASAERCPMNSTCAGCGRPISAGTPVRATPGADDTVLPWMHCACWWARQP